MSHQLNNRSEGLTLIELIVTIAVLAIVTAIAVPVINNVISSAEEASKITETKVAIDFVNRWDNAGATLTIADTRIIANFDGITAEYSHIPEGYALAGTGTVEDPYVLALDLGTFENTGSITDSNGTFSDGQGTTYTRDVNGVTITTAAANWESMTFNHTEYGGIAVETVTKVSPHGTTVGLVTKLSNTQVRIAIPEGRTFGFGIVYNGGSTGSYTFS